MPPEAAGERAGLDAMRLDGAMRRLLTFFRPRTGSWRMPTGHAWQPALAVEAVLTAYECTLDPAYLRVVAASFRRYRGRRSRYCDDDGWYLNAWVRAYDSTGEREYLDEAESLFAAMSQAWDATCGGGVWWRYDRRYKNAVTNELFLLAAARLCRRTSGGRCTGYLGWSRRAWAWFRSSGMINDEWLVNDGLDDACTNNRQTTWTCNQGVILGALVELWRATDDAGLLVQARLIADATQRRLVHPAGVLREPGEAGLDNRDAQVFKGIFAQGLARLAAFGDPDIVDPGRHRAFLIANADSLCRRAGDARDGYGLSWVGPPGEVTAATQASACLLLGEVARLTAAGPSPY